MAELYIDIGAPRAARVPAGGRGPRGQGPGTYAPSAALNAANRAMVRELQGEVVRNIQERMLPERRAASTNRLLRATSHIRNVRADANYVGVGVIDWLNSSSAAKYWRTQEEGTVKAWGRPFRGTQLYPLGRAPFPVAHGAKPGLRTFKGDRQPWMDGSRYVVKNEIRPMNAYRDAWADFRPGARAQAAVEAYLREIATLPEIEPVRTQRSRGRPLKQY